MRRVLTGREFTPALRWWVLGAMALGLLPINFDFTVLNVALPDMQRDLETSVSDLQWVVNAYTLALAPGVVVAGRLGDIYGRRRLFVAGTALFALAAAAGAAAPSVWFPAAALNAVSTSQAGMAAGVLLMSRIVGATLGVAAAGALFQSLEQRRLDDLGSTLSHSEVKDATHLLSGSAGARAALGRLPAATADRVEGVARDAFGSGLTGAMALCAAVAAVGGILVFALGRSQERIAASAATSRSRSAESL